MTPPSTSPALPHPDLAACPASFAWASFPSRDFAEPSRGSNGTSLAIQPVHGWGDHGLGLCNDVEEVLGSALLQQALHRVGTDQAIRVLPPVRHVLAPYPPRLGSIDPETAHDLFREIANGVKAAGFHRLLFLCTSPWNGELIDAVSRDVRVELQLQTFVIELAGLGLSLHPGSADRVRAQAIAASVLNQVPAAPSEPRRPSNLPDRTFRPGNWQIAEDVAPDPTLDPAALAGAAAAKLACLLQEVLARPALGTDTPVTLPPASTSTNHSRGSTAYPASRRARYLPGLSRAALQAVADKDKALVILPVGAIEQHGPHLPVGVDALLGEAACMGLHQRLPVDAPVWFGPSLALGKSNEHLDYPGTISLSARTLRRLIMAQIDAFHALGFRQFALLNTHGGNSSVIVYTLREIQQRPEVRAGMLKIPTTPELSAQEATWGFHAGEWETSLMLALRPDLVAMDRALCHYPARLEDPGELRPENAPAIFSWMTRDIAPEGVMGDATKADATKGQRWFDAAMDKLAEQVRQLISAD